MAVKTNATIKNEMSNLQVDHGFRVKILIDDDNGISWNYEPDCDELRIISSFNNAYPIFIFKFNLKPIEVINNKILGQKLIRIEIDFLEFDSTPKFDMFSTDLLYLSGEFDYPISNQLISNESSLTDQCTFIVRAVPSDAYAMMTYTHNAIYTNTSPFEIAMHLFHVAKNKINYKGTNEFFADSVASNGTGGNMIPVEQIILLPTIIKNHFDYLLKEFGLFDKFGAVYSSIAKNDTTSHRIMNLGYRLNVAPHIFKIIQIANDMENTEIVDNLAERPNDYYTYSGIHTNYIGNTTIVNTGYEVEYIHKPVDKFATYGSENDNVISIPHFSDNIPDIEPYIESDVIMNRKRYITDHICHNRFDNKKTVDQYGDYYHDYSWMASKVNKALFNLSQLSTSVEGNLPLHVFTSIGNPVLFESMTNEYNHMNGRYMLFSTNISLLRSSSWTCKADIQLIRPNWGTIQNG